MILPVLLRFRILVSFALCLSIYVSNFLQQFSWDSCMGSVGRREHMDGNKGPLSDGAAFVFLRIPGADAPYIQG